MAISALFSVNGSTSIIEHPAAYNSTVNLALVSLTDVRTISWSIASTSKAGVTAPTITPGGSPTGATASFTMPADPGDGLGRSFIVQCTVAGAGTTATHRMVVGAANDAGILPICVDETTERNATHGWSGRLNEALAASGGGSGGGPDALNLYLSTSADPGGNGTRTSPFNAFSDAQTALTEGGTIRLLDGDYSAVDPSVTKDLWLAAVTPVPVGVAGLLSFYTPSITFDDLTVAAGKVAHLVGVGVDDVSLGAGSAIEITGSAQVAGDISNSGGSGVVGVVDSSIDGSITAFELWATNSQLNGDAINLSGERCDLVGCWFGGTPTITFTGDPGVVRLDDYTAYWFDEAGGSVENGDIEIISEGNGGGGGLPLTAEQGITVLEGSLSTSGDATLITWGVDRDSLLIGDTNVDHITFGVTSGGFFSWSIDGSSDFSYDINGIELEGSGVSLKIGAGSDAAATGTIRLNSESSITARNNADSADVTLIEKDSSDVVKLGGGADAIQIEAPLTAGTISGGVNLVASSVSEDVASAGTSANIDIAIPASTSVSHVVQVRAEDASGHWTTKRVNVETRRSGTSAPVTSGPIAAFEYVSSGTGVTINATISSNNLRISVTNGMGADCHMTIRVWEVESDTTVEDS